MANAKPLVDSVPGNIGLLRDDNTILLFPFTEPAGVKASDVTGTLSDLAGAAGPDASVSGWASATMWRADPDYLYAIDSPDSEHSSLLTRDVTVQAIMAANNTTYSAPLIARGSGIDPDYRAFEIDVACSGTNTLSVRWSWQDIDGDVHADSWQSFTFSPGVPFLLTCTRRWESATSVVMRYYVDEQLLAETTSDAGDIGGDTGGLTSILGDLSSIADIWLDDLKVTNHEMSPEEVRAVWRRMTEHQPDGVAAVRAVSPPGAPWVRASADGDVGRLIKVAGAAVGFAASKAHELRETFLPDAAYKEMIARWETMVALASNDRLSLDTRRERVVSLLSRENGYAPPQIQSALVRAFDLAVEDIEILEFTPTIVDPFNSDGFDKPDDERWYLEPDAAWAATGALALTRPTGADIRFDPTTALNPVHLRMPIDNDSGLIVQVVMFCGAVDLPLTTIAGLFLYNRRTDDSLWFGAMNDAGTRKLGWVQLKAGVQSAFTELATLSGEGPYYLRITRKAAEGAYTLYWSETGFDSGGTTADITSSIQDVEWAGLAAMATDESLDSDLVATFDDFLCRIPNGGRAFHWYALRDPLLPGTPDMFSAQGIVRTLKPAHTYAYAITSRSVLCDDSGSGCDGGPLGGM